MSDLQPLIDDLLAGRRAAIGRCITLVESQADAHQELAMELLDAIAPHTGKALRIGLTGVPGVGKSTFIEAFGLHLIEQGHRVAVLAVDPSSSRTGGSILGDKTRMERLSRRPEAFIRPTPAGRTLGGVAAHCREAMLVLEAAGYDVVIVETVGVGQSEWAVSQMTDVFVLLLLAGAGDELQGIKRGIMELADVLLVNKADGDNKKPAQRAVQTLRSALKMLHGTAQDVPVVRPVSALDGTGVAEAWNLVRDHYQGWVDSGELAQRRAAQLEQAMWESVDEQLRRHAIQVGRGALYAQVVRSGERQPRAAATALVRSLLAEDSAGLRANSAAQA